MKILPARLPFLLALGLLLGGCASFDAQIPHGRGLAGMQHFFVLANLNDNHALAQHIVAALQARGLTADTGPLTMMPDDTQAVVTYQDSWSWDFGEHLYALRLGVHGPDSSESLASASFYARVPLNEPLTQTVGKLVASLFANTSSPAKPADAPPADGNPRGAGKQRVH